MLKGLGNLANLGSVMKQAQEMGAKMQTLQAELAEKRVTGVAGGGLVQVEANGAGQVLAVRIDPSLFKPRDEGAEPDREMIEDLLPTAINDASQRAKQLHAEAMQELTGGMNIPGLGDALSNLGSP